MNDVQKVILDIYKQVKIICEKHNIKYFAIGGTCLGAVRHHGFIPWDDDLDIAIPIQYFDMFWEIAEKELPSYLKTYTCYNKRHYRYIFGKIFNANTAFIEKAELGYEDAYKGIFVDVMPISSIPDTDKKRMSFYRHVFWYSKLNYIRRYPFKEMDNLKNRILWLLTKPLFLFAHVNFFSERWLNMLRKNTFGSSSLTGYTWSSRVKKFTFPMKFFKSVDVLPFENTTIDCPVCYNDYLTMQFGDYMKYPPEDQRLPHYTEIVDVNKSYKCYKGEGK